jgi:Spy/CpxP family protein refolding chaperone
MTRRQSPRSRAIAAALLALAFVTGGAAGVAADRLFGARPVIRTRIAQDMSGVLDKLELTPDQRARAVAILQRRGPRTERAMLEVAERLRAVSDSVDAELRAILTPQQRARLDSLRREPVFMIKRKVPGSATTIDTVRPIRRDS